MLLISNDSLRLFKTIFVMAAEWRARWCCCCWRQHENNLQSVITLHWRHLLTTQEDAGTVQQQPVDTFWPSLQGPWGIIVQTHETRCQQKEHYHYHWCLPGRDIFQGGLAMSSHKLLSDDLSRCLLWSMYIRVFHKSTFFGNSICTKWIPGPWVNRNWCQKMRFSQIYLLPLKLDPPQTPL